MSPARRAAAPRLIEWTGERCVPWAPDVQVVYEHYHRYLWAADLLAGRRVLDIGSGEGFGAAILADQAAEVVGVDIDTRTVEHSSLNYGAANLRFAVGSALDLSAFEQDTFDAVVAFEIIEHVEDQDRVMDELARVMSDDALLVMSTPDRRAYNQMPGHENPFHLRELSLEEFRELLASRFEHVRAWSQRTITGSHLHQLDPSAGPGGSSDYFIERAGEEWRVAGDPAPLYCVAVASRIALPPTDKSSTLADAELELLRVAEGNQARRVQADVEARAELQRQQLIAQWGSERAAHADTLRQRDIHLREQLEVRDRELHNRVEQISEREALIRRRDQSIAQIADRHERLEGELEEVRRANRRVEESVTWRAFQKLRGRLYGAVGEHSLPAKAIGLSLRTLGRVFVSAQRSAVDAAAEPVEEVATTEEQPAAPLPILFPEHPAPQVSIVIPVYSGAELTAACLESIEHRTSRVAFEVIVVDDDADADSKAVLERLRGARVLVNDRNLGYLRSVNRGAASARGDWLVLLNNDTEVTDGWLEAMLGCALSAPDVGVVTPKYLYPDGSLNEAGGIVWRDGTGANYGRGDDPTLFQYEYRRETDYGSAAALMVNVELWREIGGFDERFLPMYYEDTDLCFTARERGMRVLYEPTAVVIHVEGGTAGSDPAAGHKRFQEINRPRFVAKWRHRLESEHLPPGARNLRVAADRKRGPHVLVIDHCTPMWDQDSGSLRMFAIIRSLLDQGARVSFMADNLAAVQPYTRRLQDLGVEVLYGALDVNAELATIGPRLSLAILSRPHPASRWLDVVREFAPAAAVAYDTVDLHWLRQFRKDSLRMHAGGAAVASNGSPDQDPLELEQLGQKARALREIELALIRATDVTLVVSESERTQVERDVPDSHVLLVPNIHMVAAEVEGPSSRDGVLFVGSFAHPPNTDAAIRLVRDVMPLVWAQTRDVKVTIVGAHPPPEVQALASPLVDVAGWVQDLGPLLQHSRMLAAPLLYGAGLKGKITQALADGLPVVTTSVGAEGIDGLEDCMLVADDDAGLAANVLRLSSDDALWMGLSQEGQQLIGAHCSPEVLARRLARLLEAGPTADRDRLLERGPHRTRA